MQATSTMRCPSFGSSPVVSVSMTISRTPSPRYRVSSLPPPAHQPPAVAARTLSIAQIIDDGAQPPERRGFAQRRRHDKIGAPPFLRIGQLSPDDLAETARRHTRAAHHALTLQPR